MDGRGDLDMPTLAKQANRLIVALNRLRTTYGLELDDVLIVLAVVEINFGHNALHAASAQSVAAFIEMPYETARRRLLALTQAGRLHRREHDGYIIADITLPRELLSALRVEPEAHP